MAKKKDQTAAAAEPTPAVATVAIMLPENFSVNYGDWTLTIEHLQTMPPQGVAYLLSNGFRQSIVDAAAFSAKEKEGKSESDVAAMATEARQDRYAKILKGEVGSRVGGPRATPVEVVMKQIAEREVKAAFERKGLVVSQHKEAFKKNVAAHLERQGERIRAAAQAELDRAKDVSEVDIDLSTPEAAPTTTEQPAA